MSEFNEEMRYDYPLTPDSLVVDCGGYKGDFAVKINEKYGCRICVFEPIKEFCDEIRNRINGNPKIELYNHAIGRSNRKEIICISDNSTGFFKTDGELRLVDVHNFCISDIPPSVDLIKLNIEGMEFELLEWIFDNHFEKRFKNIQVQFHKVVPDYEARYEAIRAKLLKTHELTYDFPWCWQNFRLKERVTVNDYFDKIICINLDRRTDKWAECQKQFDKYGLIVERFSGHDMAGSVGWGNNGCTASHRGVLELICHHKWKRTLILEDDFHIRHTDFHQMFSDMIGEVPNDWDMLYLGGHYSEKPKSRVSKHVIRINRMATTSSYAVTYDFARKVAPGIFGIGPIDCLYFEQHLSSNCYIFQPRLMVQRPCFSDIQNKECDNSGCMEDTTHENMV